MLICRPDLVFASELIQSPFPLKPREVSLLTLVVHLLVHQSQDQFQLLSLFLSSFLVSLLHLLAPSFSVLITSLSAVGTSSSVELFGCCSSTFSSAGSSSKIFSSDSVQEPSPLSFDASSLP